ncbi:MAG: DNA translocase FtsK 4TM domain-containing protein, partial [Caulobacterales bacterium]|uniref:DNA translocase FtsK 4TM domain-containing protein n=1 Tax=Glycocaulis sp. TaxID=1969725 RepID=UPI003FA076B6
MARSETPSRADERDTALPPRAGLAARARAFLAGAVMVLAGIFALLAVFSHNPFDPSLNAAGSGEVTNLAGANGAVLADLMLQVTGWAGAGLALMMAGWGIILLVRGPRHRSAPVVLFRIVCGAVAIAGFAMAVSALPVPVSWPFATGLGGLLGDGLLASFTGLFGTAEIAGAGAAALVAGLIAA